MPQIHFFYEDVKFTVPNKTRLRNWIELIIKNEKGKKIKNINFIFCSDEFLLEFNKIYLHHHTLTDVITFDYSDDEQYLESDIYISIHRIKENSQDLKIPFINELHRVMIHGVLHLLGYRDKSEDELQIMREKENECLTLYIS